LVFYLKKISSQIDYIRLIFKDIYRRILLSDFDTLLGNFLFFE
jgi:hypothetical protein